MAQLIVTGGTGYMGKRLISGLADGGHQIHALIRNGAADRLPPGCIPIVCDPLNRQSFSSQLEPADTWVHLLGVTHPSPAKAEQFISIDLKSVQEAVPAARAAGVRHFIYVSVAHPAPMMRAYIAARTQAEALIRESGMAATFLRPWYVLGEGHRWPLVLQPLYWLAERFPSTAEGARRLGLVTIEQMIAALILAVQTPAAGIRVVEVPEIRLSPQILRAVSKRGITEGFADFTKE